MESVLTSAQRFFEGLNDKYEPFVRRHLAQVYITLGAATAATAVGAVLQVFDIINFGIYSAFLSLLLVLALNFYDDNGKNYNLRLGMLLGFGFASGQAMGPLLQYVIAVNPAILVTALVGTAIVFGSLSLAALLAERGKFLFLSGILVSTINTMTIMSLFNIFFRSYFVQMFQIYVGLFVMVAFVVFDTQNIIEKCRAGNTDVIKHALDLFFDLLSMFRRLLIILKQKEERKREDRRKRN